MTVLTIRNTNMLVLMKIGTSLMYARKVGMKAEPALEVCTCSPCHSLEVIFKFCARHRRDGAALISFQEHP